MYELRVGKTITIVQDLAEISRFLKANKITAASQVRLLGDEKWSRVGDVLSGKAGSSPAEVKSSPKLMRARCSGCKQEFQIELSHEERIVSCKSCGKKMRFPSRPQATNAPSEKSASRPDSLAEDLDFSNFDYDDHPEEQQDTSIPWHSDFGASESQVFQHPNRGKSSSQQSESEKHRSSTYSTEYLSPDQMPNVVSLCLTAIVDAFGYVVRNPLGSLLLTFTVTSASFVFSVIPFLWVCNVVLGIGYMRIVRQMMNGETTTIAELVGFLRHGWNSVWHLLVLLFSTFVAVICGIAMILLLLLLVSEIVEFTTDSPTATSASEVDEISDSDEDIPSWQETQYQPPQGIFARLVLKPFVNASRVIGPIVLLSIISFPFFLAVTLLSCVFSDMAEANPSNADCSLTVNAIERLANCGFGVLFTLSVPALFLSLSNSLTNYLLVRMFFGTGRSVVLVGLIFVVWHSVMIAFQVSVASQMRKPVTKVRH